MNSVTEKLQILESLNALDKTQTEKVLAYIKGMLTPNQEELEYKRNKREAMKEIRQALNGSRRLKLSL
jgi:tellurite resistance protein